VKLKFLEYPIECLKCGNQFKAKIGGSKDYVDVPCPACGALRRCDAKEVRVALKEANRQLASFADEMNKIGKK
jgi:predicted RNA-binding Zn-ribbon protein involved in translation (DUF1610 family)